MPDPSNYLRILSDPFTPVRDEQGRLLGCVPRVPDNSEVVVGSGGAFELRLAAQVCVCVNLGAGQVPTSLDNFVPLDDADTDLATPLSPPDNADLAEGL